VADDAGALLVRSGLVTSNALDDARSRVEHVGGTLGEQLVAVGAIDDDTLTDFYKSRLLVPQVNPNTLAKLPIKVIAAIPSDMAIELRAIPVALDHDNNLTVAMSDPSDRHAVDEIAFFTGAYVVRAVATQMQIAWCLAHYYGHLTALGHRLLQQTSEGVPSSPAPHAGAPAPRTKGLTGRVEATRHRAIAPITGPVDVVRPTSGELDLPPAVALAPVAVAPPEPALAAIDGAVPQPRARSVSGEIRVPGRRAASIRPTPSEDPYEDESGPVITMEVDETQPDAKLPDDDPTGPRKLPVPMRRRKAKTDPPELAARAGEVAIATGPMRKVDDEPRIIIAEDVLAPPPPSQPDTSGELRAHAHQHREAAPATTIEVDDTSVGVVIHEHYDDLSEPVLLDQKRVPVRRLPSDMPTAPAVRAPTGEPLLDDDVVVLDARKAPRPRPERRTQVGIGVISAAVRTHRDTEASAVPDMVDDAPTDGVTDRDATRVDTRAAPPAAEDTTDETLAAPPSPDDTGSHPTRPPGSPGAASPAARTASSAITTPRAVADDDDDDDDDRGTETAVMTAVELDAAIPERSSEVMPGHLQGKSQTVDYDPLDEGWGPPGTTIPPPLLGAIPGSDENVPTAIPIDVDSAPLIVAPPSPPEASRGSPAIPQPSGQTLVRALEDATSRSVKLITALEHASDRNSVVALMVAHLAESHRRAGFFSLKPGPELAVFTMQPVPPSRPTAALRLDRASTLQDVVGTRLPYRGPMHDDASRTFLANILGACPPEILLVPVAIRERVVGVLFGEHRMRHTFDDQLALAARAAGMALERILQAKRG